MLAEGLALHAPWYAILLYIKILTATSEERRAMHPCMFKGWEGPQAAVGGQHRARPSMQDRLRLDLGLRDDLEMSPD